MMQDGCAGAGSVMVTPGYEQSALAAGPHGVGPLAVGAVGQPVTVAAPGAGPGAAQAPAGPPGLPAAQDFHQPDQAQFEADKRAVYKHPLFPLLALLFERCEQATQSAECPNSDSFNMDIQAFVQHQERDRKPFLMNDPEVDGLMIKAIQVLRIHLLELEKVQELCKDFCNRYITCLKGKMQSENLLRSDYASGYEHNNNNSSCHSSESSSPPGQHSSYPTSPHAVHLTPASPHPVQVVSSTGGGSSNGGSHQQQQQQQQQHFAGAGPGSGDMLGVGAVGGVGGAFAMALSPSPSALALPSGPPSPPAPPSPGLIHGSTPLSQIGANPFPPPNDSSLLHSTLSPSPTSPGSGDDDDDFLGRGKKQKRGVLPKHATSIMRSWLFQHLVHPYPTEDEKRTIAAQTNLTLLQVNNWFINARRRILQPMLDASNTADSTGSSSNNNGAGKVGGSKKNKVCSKESARQAAAQRFWPDNMAALQPHLLGQDHNGAGHGDSSLLSSGAEDSDGENDGGWSQDEDGDEGVDGDEEESAVRTSHHRLKAEPSSDSEQ